MKDKHTEDRIVERAVDVCFEVAKRQVNPYVYLYHNPREIRTMQYFAHWTQRWTERQAYVVLLKAAQITGFEPVPSCLLYRNIVRDGWSGRRIRCGSLSFFLIKKEEMPPGLMRRYTKFVELLQKELRKNGDSCSPMFGTSQNDCT